MALIRSQIPTAALATTSAKIMFQVAVTGSGSTGSLKAPFVAARSWSSTMVKYPAMSRLAATGVAIATTFSHRRQAGEMHTRR